MVAAGIKELERGSLTDLGDDRDFRSYAPIRLEEARPKLVIVPW